MGKKTGARQKPRIKKQFGQHFLRDQLIVDEIVKNVTLTPESSVVEIGCGDGFLTRTILEQQLKRLWVFEIDPEWAHLVRDKYSDVRMTIFEADFLDVSWKDFEPYKPWTLLANLPYQITFPVIFGVIAHKHLFAEGVLMVQEEVAQKVVKQSGRGYGFNSLFIQHYLEVRLLSKISPGAFYPPPKIFSRLIYFKPRMELDQIQDEQGFWLFIKRCFASPRRTLKNNLPGYHYDLQNVSSDILLLRAQQMGKSELVELWNLVRK